MKYNTCPRCKTKISVELAQCPECGHTFGERKNHMPAIIGSCLLIAAFTGGLAFSLGAEFHTVEPSPTLEIIETLAPATPVPTPTVDSIEIYAFGRELDADGFTAYVGDKPFTLSAYPQPEISHPQISWSMSRGPSDQINSTLNGIFVRFFWVCHGLLSSCRVYMSPSRFNHRISSRIVSRYGRVLYPSCERAFVESKRLFLARL